MIPRRITKTLTAASTQVIATTQAAASAGPINLVTSAGVSLDTQRRVLITLTASNSGNVFSLRGTNDGGVTIGETIAADSTATTAVSTGDYKTVTLVSNSSALSGNISVGTNTTASIPWQAANVWLNPYSLSLAVDLLSNTAASAIFTYTLDPDPCGIASPNTGVSVEYTAGTQMVAQTTSGTALIGTPMSAWRFTTTTGTGQLIIRALEPGIGLA
jgi:hypothetical protein